MLSRQRYDVNTDTGTQSFTGSFFMGGLMQIGWNATTPDTGADLEISLQPGDGADTGEGWTVYSNNDCLGADFLQPLSRNVVHANGLDTGTGGAQAAIAAAGDKLAIKVTPGGAAVVGTLYVWTYTG